MKLKFLALTCSLLFIATANAGSFSCRKSAYKALTKEQIKKIEKTVNDNIYDLERNTSDAPVYIPTSLILSSKQEQLLDALDFEDTPKLQSIRFYPNHQNRIYIGANAFIEDERNFSDDQYDDRIYMTTYGVGIDAKNGWTVEIGLAKDMTKKHKKSNPNGVFIMVKKVW